MEQVEREALREMVRNGVVEIHFDKVRGGKRVMRASTNPLYMDALDSSAERTTVPNSDILVVRDVEIHQWRSIRYDSINFYVRENATPVLLTEETDNAW